MSVLHDEPVVIDRSARLRGESLLKDDFLSIAQVSDDRALNSGIQNFVSDIGFDRYGVVVLHDDRSGQRNSTVLAEFHNAPPEYLQTYDSREVGKLDPVMQHCKRSRRSSMGSIPMWTWVPLKGGNISRSLVSRAESRPPFTCP